MGSFFQKRTASGWVDVVPQIALSKTVWRDDTEVWKYTTRGWVRHKTVRWNALWLAPYWDGSQAPPPGVGFANGAWQSPNNGPNGPMTGMVGFNFSDIKKQLANHQGIDEVRLEFDGVGAINSTVTFRIGTHNYSGSSNPSTYRNVVSQNLTSKTVSRGEPEKFVVSDTFATQFASGAATGLIVEPLSSDSGNAYHGMFTGASIEIDFVNN